MSWKVVTTFGVVLWTVAHAHPPYSEQRVKIVHHVGLSEKGGQSNEHGDKYAWAYPSYEFAYKVSDPHTHDFKGQYEKREGDKLKGVYWLTEPNGRKRIVKYHVEKDSGFKAHVGYKEPNENQEEGQENNQSGEGNDDNNDREEENAGNEGGNEGGEEGGEEDGNEGGNDGGNGGGNGDEDGNQNEGENGEENNNNEEGNEEQENNEGGNDEQNNEEESNGGRQRGKNKKQKAWSWEYKKGKGNGNEAQRTEGRRGSKWSPVAWWKSMWQGGLENQGRRGNSNGNNGEQEQNNGNEEAGSNENNDGENGEEGENNGNNEGNEGEDNGGEERRRIINWSKNAGVKKTIINYRIKHKKPEIDRASRGREQNSQGNGGNEGNNGQANGNEGQGNGGNKKKSYKRYEYHVKVHHPKQKYGKRH